MTSFSGEKLKQKAEKAIQNVELNRDVFEQCDEYINPFRNTFDRIDGVYNRSARMYDSTAMIASNNFVNTMTSNFTPAFSRWAELKAGPAIGQDEEKKLNQDLEAINNTVFAYINASNFATASAEMYYELSKSTGVLLVLEGDDINPLNFVSAPLSQMGLIEGKEGKIDFIVRKYRTRAGLVKEIWKRAEIPEASGLADMVKNEPDTEVDLRECFYYDYQEFIWRYEVLYDCDVIYKSQSKYCPAVVVRWFKIPGIVTGVGPMMMALSDIKTLNKMKQLSLQMAALNVFGMYTITDDGVLNPNAIRLKPGAFIPVKRNGGAEGRTIEALPTAGNFQLQEFMQNDLKDQIKQVSLDNRLPPENAAVRSAFEIAERIKELQTDIGAAFGRLIYEFVIPLYQRVLEILNKKGVFSLPEGFEIDSLFVKVQVVSPIASQQNMDDVNRFVQAMEMVKSISPELAMVSFDLSKAPQWISDKLGAPASLLNDEASKEQLMQTVAQVVAAMQQGQANV